MKEVAILPEQAPVMPLPGAVLFSARTAPALHLRAALSRNARATPSRRSECFVSRYSGPRRAMEKRRRLSSMSENDGLIRACVGRVEGTSNLIYKVCNACASPILSNWIISNRRARTLRSDNETTVETDALAPRSWSFTLALRPSGGSCRPKIDRYVTDMTDLAMLADLMASTFIDESGAPSTSPRELDLNARLRLVIQYLRDETGNAAA